MIKLLGLTKRHEGWSRKDFCTYWQQHGLLVSRVNEFSRHVRKYVQNYPQPNWPDDSWDGVGEIWFQSLADMTAAFTEPRYLELIRPDEVHLARLDVVAALLLVDSVVYTSPLRSAHKLFRFFGQRADNSYPFRHLWTNDHRLLFERMPGIKKHVVQYVQSGILVSQDGDSFNAWTSRTFACDGVETMWFRSANALISFLSTSSVGQLWREATTEHTAPSNTFDFPVFEKIIIAENL